MKLNFNETLCYGVPSVTTLFIDIGNRIWKETQKSLKDNSWLMEVNRKGKKINWRTKSHDKFFEIIEKRIASVVLSYSAIESFTNDYIPEEIIEVTNSQEKSQHTIK